MKNVALALLVACLPFQASAYTGRVFLDGNLNGQYDRGEKLLKDVVVSNGQDVIKTDAQGQYVLPGRERARFVFVSTPSNMVANGNYYKRIEKGKQVYDFPLRRAAHPAGKDGTHRFMQITDTEISTASGQSSWVKYLKEYSANEDVSFIIHTGDICYEKGLKAHIGMMNSGNMGTQVYYCIGNHDLVRGKYGEELFESIYGPVYYSFNAGNVHYIVTPMMGGDYQPSYDRSLICKWLANDLNQLKAGTPVVIFNHDLLTYNGDKFVFDGGKGQKVNLDDYNLKAWIYGHWHHNIMKRQGKVLTICTAPPDKGGIDHSCGAFRVIDVSKSGDISAQLRYCYVDGSLTIAAPQGLSACHEISVNAYASACPVRTVTADVSCQGKKVKGGIALKPMTDWNWRASLSLPMKYEGKELTLHVKARLSNGKVMEESTSFHWQAAPRLHEGMGVDNLGGNSQHICIVKDTLSGKAPVLLWSKNVKGNILNVSPLVHDGLVFIATVDENLKGESAIYALRADNGEVAWRYPVKYSIKNTMAIGRGKVFAQDATGGLYAVDCKTGKTSWTVQLPFQGLPPITEGLAVKGDTLFAGVGESLTAFAVEDGKILWRNKEWQHGEAATETVTVGNGVVVHGSQWGALYGNDSRTGKLLWSVSDHGLRHRGCSPTAHGDLLYLISERSFFILDGKTGKTIVRKPLPYNVDVASTPLLTGKEIIFGTADHGLVALDQETLDEKWNFQTSNALLFTSPYTHSPSSTVETSPVLSGRTVYVGASDGTLYAVNAATGARKWQYSSGAPILGTAAVSGNMLVTADYGGSVTLFAFPQ